MKKSNDDLSNRDLMSSIYKDYEKKGGAGKLPGMGKPLPKGALEGDIFTKIVKNANYLPAWIKLQKEIKHRIENLMKLSDDEKRTAEAELINKEIMKYNRSCPAALQKNLISLSELEKHYKLWE
ncbi:DUF1992 domain-containing protein [Metabacillus idriensis]|uniref:DnaJ family domain-containing protein n=1 Tax=Metabacillus idriensis TaxID=324768 RepID=UPI002812CEFB|nr:DnaJ family domain-containing protein [Metabacillus idriensis]MDR0136248.1 DUF1992 domain-containing protein [Metabacillus idriensis]